MLKHLERNKTHWQSKWAGFLKHLGVTHETYNQVRKGIPNKHCTCMCCTRVLSFLFWQSYTEFSIEVTCVTPPAYTRESKFVLPVFSTDAAIVFNIVSKRDH